MRGPQVAIVDAMSQSTAESAAERWAQTRTFHHSLYSPERIAAAKAERGASVSVCLPARECAETVGEIVGALVDLRERGAIDEIVVSTPLRPTGLPRSPSGPAHACIRRRS